MSAGERPHGRVAHVLMRFNELSETFINDSIQQLDRLGWEAHVVAFTLINRDLFPFPPADRVRLVSRPAATTLVVNRLRRRTMPERQASWLAPALEDLAPDVVHAHFGHTAAAVVPASMRLGLPLVVSLHGTDVTVLPHAHRVTAAEVEHAPWAPRAYEQIFRQARCLILASSFLAGEVERLGYTGRTEVVPAGLDLDRLTFDGAPRDRAPGDPARILFVGRQFPVKGLDVLLRALPAVRSSNPDVALDVIGDGQFAAANAALARELEIDELVSFHGARTHVQTLAAISAADLVVVPSRTAPGGDTESSSLVAREALALGTPVVATDSGGIPENFPPPQRAQLVPAGSHAELAGAVVRALRERRRGDGQALEARAWVEANFDGRRLAQRVAAVYEWAADGGRPRNGRL